MIFLQNKHNIECFKSLCNLRQNLGKALNTWPLPQFLSVTYINFIFKTLCLYTLILIIYALWWATSYSCLLWLVILSICCCFFLLHISKSGCMAKLEMTNKEIHEIRTGLCKCLTGNLNCKSHYPKIWCQNDLKIFTHHLTNKII